jgi:hypothetical protein
VEAAGEGAEDEVRALVDLRPYAAEDAAGSAAWWVASDLGSWRPDARSDRARPRRRRSLDHAGRVHVRTPSAASSTSAPAAASRPCTRAGTPARRRHDLSARALAFARLNLALNGVRAELRQGDLLEPAARERSTSS